MSKIFKGRIMKLIGIFKPANFKPHRLFISFLKYGNFIGSIDIFDSLIVKKEYTLYLFEDTKFIYVSTNPLFLMDEWKKLGRLKVDDTFTLKDSTENHIFFGLGYSYTVYSFSRVVKSSFDPELIHTFSCDTPYVQVSRNEEKTAFRFSRYPE